MKESFLQTRREFLSHGLKGCGLIAASSFVPTFLIRTAFAAGAETDAKILVVVQLSGGNDGLNTVVPFTDDLYYKARPTLGLKATQVMKVNDQMGLHPEMKALKTEYDEGKVAVIQNVGYPNPDRSHFRSMEIWHTGSDNTGKRTVDGWLGRYFDAQCQGADPRTISDKSDIGMSFGKIMPQSFRNKSNVGLALDNPATFQWNTSGETIGLAKAQESIFAKLNQPGTAGSKMMSRMEGLGGIVGNEPETVDFLKHTAMNAVVAGDRIRGILAKAKVQTSYPDTGLSHQLQMIAKLIGGGFPTRVYYANQGGYDTHSDQAGSHGRLLKDVAESVHAFNEDLRAQKNSGKVMVLAFSEFGRRVAENGSKGTDHGAAAPMFLFGDKVKGGVHGNPPNLKDLTDGDLKHQLDFRQVYAAVLENWLETKSEPVLRQKFDKLPVV